MAFVVFVLGPLIEMEKTRPVTCSKAYRTRLIRGTYDMYVGANLSAHEVDPYLFLRFLVPYFMFRDLSVIP